MTEQRQTPPSGFATVTPYLVVKDAVAAIDYYTRVFDAYETFRLEGPGNRIAHAEIQIGNAMVMLTSGSETYTFMETIDTLGGSPVQLYLYMPNAEELFERACEHGASVIMPMENQGDGDLRGGVRDPFGFIWWIARVENPEGREAINQQEAAQR